MLTDLEAYKKARILRKKGKSYASIGNQLGLSKGTLSGWFGNKKWSNEIKTRLNQSRLKMAKKNLMAANLARTESQHNRRDHYIKEAQDEFKRQTDNPLFLLGLGIYWGEGDKSNNGRVGVINTDPELLKIVANFYRECLRISDKDLRIGLFLYDDIEMNFAIQYWSNVLLVPRSQFIKVQMLKSRSKLTKSRSIYGICSLYCSSTELRIKIHEWIRLLSIQNAGIV